MTNFEKLQSVQRTLKKFRRLVLRDAQQMDSRGIGSHHHDIWAEISNALALDGAYNKTDVG